MVAVERGCHKLPKATCSTLPTLLFTHLFSIFRYCIKKNVLEGDLNPFSLAVPRQFIPPGQLLIIVTF